jgi:glycerol-3-phosphate acyltransferase PlsY
MKFKGGKGLACIGGMILRYDPLVFLAMLLFEGVLVLVTNYICFVPMTAVILFPVIYGVMERDLIGALILCVLIPVVFYKHKENLKRIKNGTELRFSYLWNKEKEIERLNLPQEENQ